VASNEGKNRQKKQREWLSAKDLVVVCPGYSGSSIKFNQGFHNDHYMYKLE
jgi:hypothetical protein